MEDWVFWLNDWMYVSPFQYNYLSIELYSSAFWFYNLLWNSVGIKYQWLETRMNACLALFEGYPTMKGSFWLLLDEEQYITFYVSLDFVDSK